MEPAAETLPEPFVSADTDVRDLDGFMLNVERLLASELWALSSGDEFKAAMALWCRAWKQFPAGSLPDDDRILAVFSGAGGKWPKVKAMALRGFVKCRDGRLYHRVLCEDVRRAAIKKLERRERTRAATEARKNARNVQRNAPDDDERNVDVTRSQGQGQGQGQGRKKERKEGSDPNGSAVEAPAWTDLKVLVFGQCLDWVAGHSNKSADSLRPLFGRWCRDHGDAAVIAAVDAAKRESPIEPVAWIIGRLGAPKQRGGVIGGYIPMAKGPGS